MNGKWVAWAALAVLAACWMNGKAAAYWPYGGCQGYLGSYRPSVYSREYIPYFAQHPPVYYSYPVQRTYGRSPYAWPPVVSVAAREPLVMQNPYVVERVSMKMDSPTQRPTPLRIVNPYVEQVTE